MPAIKYRVTLTEEEKKCWKPCCARAKSAARKQTRARILLKAAAGCKDAEIMEARPFLPPWSSPPGKMCRARCRSSPA